VTARIIRNAGKNSVVAEFADIYHISEKIMIIGDPPPIIAKIIVDHPTDLKIIIEIQKEINPIDIDMSHAFDILLTLECKASDKSIE